MPISSTPVDVSSSSNSVVSKTENRPAPIQTYEGHEDMVLCVAFFQDEQRLITGSRDGGLRVWNRETGAQIGNHLEGHARAVRAVDVSPDGRIIASSSSDSTVRIWDAETELLRTLGHEDDVNSLHISPDSKRVTSGSDDGMRVWDIEAGELAFKPIKCNGIAGCVRYSPSGDRIASAAISIQIWTADTAEHILSIEELVFPLAWSLDGEQIIGGGDKDIIIWDSSTGEQIGTWEAHGSWITSLSLSRNGTHLATCSHEEKTVFVFDITTGEQIAAYEHDDKVNEIAYSPSGRSIATACRDKKAYLWDAPEDPQPTVTPIQTYEWHGNRVFCVAFFPDEQQLVTGSLGGGVRVWNRETGAQIGNVLQGHSDVVWAVDVSPDRRTIVSGSDDNMVRIWDAKTEDRPAPIQTYEGHEGWVACVAFFQDEQRLVTGSADGSVRVLDRETGAQIGNVLQGHTKVVWAVDVSPDGSTIVSGSSDNTVRIWDAETEELLHTLDHKGNVQSVHISPDSKRVASGSLRVWDIETG
ncbi:hypothetical protein HYDPIDRAFT_98506, partial [Hydnomerulius pinastri MD-312]